MAVSPVDLARTLVARSRARRTADAVEADRIVARVRESLPELRARRGFGRAWLIGSLAWGAFGERSDVDLVVEGAREEILRAVADEIARESGRRVDVLALEELDERFRERVLAEGMLVA